MMQSAAQSLMCSSALRERDPLDYAFLRRDRSRHLRQVPGRPAALSNAHDTGITVQERLLSATQSFARIRQQSASLCHELNAGVNDPLATRSAGTVATLHPDKATHGNQEEKSH